MPLRGSVDVGQSSDAFIYAMKVSGSLDQRLDHRHLGSGRTVGCKSFMSIWNSASSQAPSTAGQSHKNSGLCHFQSQKIPNNCPNLCPRPLFLWTTHNCEDLLSAGFYIRHQGCRGQQSRHRPCSGAITLARGHFWAFTPT